MSSAPAPAAAPAAAPTNGAASKMTAPAASPPTKDTSTGPQTPTETKANPAPPVDDDPEIDFGDIKLRRSAARREIERSKSTAKLLSDAERRNRAAEAIEKTRAERVSKKDIAALVEELGLSPEEERQLLSERLYSRHIAPEQMTPEQRELAQLKEKLSAREAADKKAADAAAAKRKESISLEEGKKLHAELIAAAEAGKIPKSRSVIKRIMDKAIAFDSRGMELPLEQLATLVRADLAHDVGAYTDATSIDERKSMMGPERFRAEEKKWHAHFKAMLKAPPVAQAIRAPPQRTSDGKFKRDTLTPQEFLARVNGRK
jgi:hypothetical protein